MGTREQQPESGEVNLIVYWDILLRHKRLIGIATGAAASISVIVSLLLPNYYAAKASVMPGAQDSSIAAISAALPGGLGAAAGGLLGMNSPSDVWVGILNSNSVRDRIISRFNLKEAYGEDTIEEARKALDKLVTVSKAKDDIVSITVEDKSPQVAADLANAFVEELDKVNMSATMTTGKSMRLFVEQRLGQTKKELASVEERIRAFQVHNKAVKIDAQSQAMIETFGELKGSLMAKEVQLQTLLTYATDENPSVQMLKAEVAGLKKQLMAAETGSSEGSDIFIPAKNLPDIGLEYARLLREAKIQETLFEFLTQQYEMARIQEVKDSPTLQVLDRAVVPEKKSSPNRAFIVIVSTFLGALLSSAYGFLKEYLHRSRR